MNRRTFIQSAAGVGGAVFFGGAPTSGMAQTPSTLKVPADRVTAIGGRAQLFVDRHLVDDAQGIQFVVHPARKHPLNPLVVADQPWEGWWVRMLGGSTLYDEEEQVFKMWYTSVSRCFPKFAVHFAKSRDGVHWEKPLVGTLQCPGHLRHNAVLTNVETLSVYLDYSEPNPAHRYKMIGFDNRITSGGAAQAFVSPDGLVWTPLSDQPGFASSDVMTAFFDRGRKNYVAFPKVPTVVRGVRRRCFGQTTSTDLVQWAETRMAFVPDERDDEGTLARLEPARPLLRSPVDPALMRTEIYGISTHQTESHVLAFPWIFSVSGHPPGSTKDEGVCELQLASSRDLRTWDRPYRTALVPRGPIGAWDCAFVTGSAQAFRYGDEVRLYYSAQNYPHAHPASKTDPGPGSKLTRAIGLATWPVDRFVSADAAPEGGRIITTPVRFAGNWLELNLCCKSQGYARVQVLDASGKALEGRGLSDPISADSLRHTVTWNRGNSDVSALQGRPVRLRFELNHTELYSFGFRT